ncbi:MAG: TIGR01777 family oxidoreductase [Ignavibacteriaceae bacterium]
MTHKKVVLTGATGLIGKRLYKALVKRGDEVTIFTNSMVKGVQKINGADEYIEWNYREKNHWQSHINGKDAVVHLAGANLSGKRWTETYKKEIIESRQISTRNLVDAFAKAEKKPQVFVCASAVGYYGNYGDDVITEEDHAGDDFLAEVCKIWEEEASRAEEYGIRRVSIRTGIVLSKEGGALNKMLIPFNFFAGGPLGNGSQWFPWIHIDDIVGAYLFAIDNPDLSGAVNAAAPDPVTMKDFAKTLGRVLRRPSFFHVPKFALTLVAGEIGATITHSQKVIPKRLLENGFRFEYDDLEDALRNILKKRSFSNTL